MKRVPPHGVLLDQRQKWGNIPFFVMVCIGMGAWKMAKCWRESPNDISVLVVPDGKSPKNFNWPVNKCDVYIERLPGPGDDVITDLIKTLLSFGANGVIVWDKYNNPKFLRYWKKED